MIYSFTRIGTSCHRNLANQSLIPWRANFKRFSIAPLFSAEKKPGLRAGTHFHDGTAPERSFVRYSR
jgi:hypothetical protein